MTGDYAVCSLKGPDRKVGRILVPRPVYADALREGMVFDFDRRVHVTEAMIESFAEATGDRNALHFDAEYAGTSLLRGKVAHGLLVFGTLHGVMHAERFWNKSLQALLRVGDVSFLRPVRSGDILSYKLFVTGKENREPGGWIGDLPMNIVHFTFQIFKNGYGIVVVEGDFSVVLPNTPQA